MSAAPLYPAATTLGALLADNARAGAGRPAIFYRDRIVSYGELHEQATAVAKAMLALGIRRGDRVGALLGNQPEWLVACFGAATIGAVLVPINTWYKKEEIAWLIRHSGMRLLIAAASFLKQDYAALLDELAPGYRDVPAGALRCEGFPDLETIVTVGAGRAEEAPWRAFLRLGETVDDAGLARAAATVTADDAAMILYTSGSTAEPKGVLLHHGNAIRNGFDMGGRRAVTGEDRVWIGTPLFYALGGINAMPVAVSRGAAIVLQDFFTAETALNAIEQTRATVYYGTGNMTRALLDHPDYAQRRIGSLKKGNAGTFPEYKRMTLIEMGITQACAAYGLTESYGNATVSDADDPVEAKIATNGRPLPGTELVIVDPASGKPLGPNEPGLILLRGHVASGYFRNAEETAKAFRPDGFFDTGDLGHLDADGRLVFHARIKEIIKSGGINVSPLEIEQLLVKHPDIADAYVVGAPEKVRGEVIVAFVIARRQVAAAAVQDFVREKAASFKVPHYVLFRTEEQLPRLASGKVAKYQLVKNAVAELGL
ncbi:MAG: AMP-binding protein [Rhodospirillaceae bacterium]|nr:AMP-binding protein [Rhodospirillaceae bacterium]